MPATPDIVDALDAMAEDLERDRGFLGDRQIGGARAEHADRAVVFRQRQALGGDAAGARVEHRLRHGCAHGGVLVLIGPADEEDAVRFHDDARDGGDFAGRLAGAEDDLRKTAAVLAIGIDAGESEIDEAHGSRGRGTGAQASACRWEGAQECRCRCRL